MKARMNQNPLLTVPLRAGGTEQARALLREALRDFASPVRMRAVETTTRQPCEDALELQVDCLADHDTEVRRATISGLQQLRDRRAVGALVALLRDSPNAQTQHLAMGALWAITGQPFYARYTDPPEKRQQACQAWLRWWQQAQREFATRQPKPVHPAHTKDAPDLILRTLEGESIALRRPPKPLLLNF